MRRGLRSGARAGDGMNARVRAAANASHAQRAAVTGGRHVLAPYSSNYPLITGPAIVVQEIRRLVAP